jgi:hypothetical protein
MTKDFRKRLIWLFHFSVPQISPLLYPFPIPNSVSQSTKIPLNGRNGKCLCKHGQVFVFSYRNRVVTGECEDNAFLVKREQSAGATVYGCIIA